MRNGTSNPTLLLLLLLLLLLQLPPPHEDLVNNPASRFYSRVGGISEIMKSRLLTTTRWPRCAERPEGLRNKLCNKP